VPLVARREASVSAGYRSYAGAVPAARPLPGLTAGLFVHTVHRPKTGAPPAGLAAIRDLLDQDGIGVIYTVPPTRNRPAAATACVMQTRLRAPRADILLDAALYTGSARRKLARDGIDQSWLNHQHRDRLVWALTDSGYVADGDLEGLRTILSQSRVAHERAQARSQGVLATLPLAVGWLTERVDMLVAELNRASTPVALMLEHHHDPLGEPGAVDGLVTVLSADVPVAVLRCDTAVLGALAHGAAAVSVGDSSATRHIYPASTNPAGGGGGHPPVSTLVPALLRYVHLDKIDAAITAAANLPVWTCRCRVCRGQRLDWISDSTQPAVYAFEHAVSALATTARALFADTGSPAWPVRWGDAVRDAIAGHEAVARTGSAETWRTPASLRHWLAHYERSGPPTIVS
jgi:hypothetical protein